LDVFLTRPWQYKLIAIDVPNLAVSLAKHAKKDGLHNLSPFGVLQRKIITGRCKTYCFATANFAHFQSKLPPSPDVVWHIESRFKHAEGRYVDIDCVMAATIAAELEKNHPKITDLMLCTGDGDLGVLLDIASKLRIPVTLVGVVAHTVSPHLKAQAHQIITLF
jgi:uncharacterized LabA/DUF88 family protein